MYSTVYVMVSSLRTCALLMMSLLPLVPAQAAELVVSAAASLTNAFREAGKRFEEKHAGDQIVLNFASSDVLLAQIAKGAPVDVFATADMESMERAEKQGLLASGTRRTLLRNQLVLIAPAGSKTPVEGLASLQEAAVRRIALGNPASVPAGRYARQALESAGLWSKLEPKCIFAQNVRQALDYVARGEVDAGLVYATDAAIMADKVRVAADVPTDRSIVYPIAVVKDTRNHAVADAFLQFLGSSEAQAVFARYGFRQPD
jgi:molybdate transport system substrate-binding protein